MPSTRSLARTGGERFITGAHGLARGGQRPRQGRFSTRWPVTGPHDRAVLARIVDRGRVADVLHRQERAENRLDERLNASGPAERRTLMRLSLRRLAPNACWPIIASQGWWSGLGLPLRFMAALEVRGRVSGHRRSTAVVIAAVDGQHYLVSMLGPGSDCAERRGCARRGRAPPGTPAPGAPRAGAARAAGTDPPRVRTPRAAVSTSRSPSMPCWPSSRRSPSGIRCTGLIPPEATPHHLSF